MPSKEWVWRDWWLGGVLLTPQRRRCSHHQMGLCVQARERHHRRSREMGWRKSSAALHRMRQWARMRQQRHRSARMIWNSPFPSRWTARCRSRPPSSAPSAVASSPAQGTRTQQSTVDLASTAQPSSCSAMPSSRGRRRGEPSGFHRPPPRGGSLRRFATSATSVSMPH